MIYHITFMKCFLSLHVGYNKEQTPHFLMFMGSVVFLLELHTVAILSVGGDVAQKAGLVTVKLYVEFRLYEYIFIAPQKDTF